MASQIWRGKFQTGADLLLHPRTLAFLAMSNTLQIAESAFNGGAGDESKKKSWIVVPVLVVFFAIIYCISNEDACDNFFLTITHCMGRDVGGRRGTGRPSITVHQSDGSDEDSSSENNGAAIGLSSSPTNLSVRPWFVRP